MELRDIHEEVYTFLLKKHKTNPNLRYTLRKINRFERLNKGFWFLGSDTELYISFWTVFGQDNKLQHPTIRFQIKENDVCSLIINESRQYTDKEGKDQEIVLDELAKLLSLDKKNKEKWEKEYDGQYIKHLTNFIDKQIPFINSFFELKGVEAYYPPVGEVDFLARLTNIENIKIVKNDEKFNQFIKNKLFIETLALSNINAFKEDLTASFHKPVTCFVGGNGSGKTTILRAIALGLVGFDAFKEKLKEKKERDKLNLLSIQKIENDEIHFEKEGGIDVYYRYKNKEEEFGVTFESIDNGALVDEDGFKNSKESGGILGKEKSLNTLVIAFAQQSYAKTNASPRRRPNISDIEALILNESDNRFDEFVEWFQTELEKDSINNTSFRAFISTILNVVNDCVRKEENDKTNDIDFIGLKQTNLKTANNPNGIPIGKLSQGYRNLIAWVGFLGKRLFEYKKTLVEDGILSENIDFLKLPAVCLIDEIDTYLHPDWQYSILKGLVDSFPNVQFIITSHSPFLLTTISSRKLTIYELNTEGGKVELKELNENIYGADANRATDLISDKRMPMINSEFKEIERLIKENVISKAEIILNSDELSEVKESDPDIVSARSRISTKRMIQNIKSANP